MSRSNVPFHLGSGLANPSDASFSLTTNVPSGSYDANASTGSHQVCDAAGNCDTVGSISGIAKHGWDYLWVQYGEDVDSSAKIRIKKPVAAYVEQDRSAEELSADGFDPDVVERAVAMIDRAEYKRRQAPPGVRLRQKAFGRDRRTPITNRWRG